MAVDWRGDAKAVKVAATKVAIQIAETHGSSDDFIRITEKTCTQSIAGTEHTQIDAPPAKRQIETPLAGSAAKT